jgi:hypothetical protein
VIRRVAGDGDATAYGRHLKNVSAVLLTHDREGGARGVDDAVKACVHDGLKVFGAHLLEGGKLAVSGVIDEDVEAPEGVEGGLDSGFGRGFVAHFEGDGFYSRAVLCCQRR